MKEVTITIPIEPRGQGRPRAFVKGKHAGVYKPAEDRNYEATLRQYFEDACPEPLQGPVELTIEAWFTMPKSEHRKRDPRSGHPHTKKPDLDNVLKAAKDAGNGVLWLDDSQVWTVRAEKWVAPQGAAPRLIVRVQATIEA